MLTTGAPPNILIRANIYNNDPIRYIVSVVSCFVLPIPIYIAILPYEFQVLQSRNTLVTRVLGGGPFSTDRANVGSQHTPRSRWTAWTFTVVLHASAHGCTRPFWLLNRATALRPSIYQILKGSILTNPSAFFGTPRVGFFICIVDLEALTPS